jgi:hypothetical protein
MSDSNEKKGPLAVIAAVLALGALGLKAGCAKLVATGGDDVLRAAGSAASHGGAEAAEAGAQAAAHADKGLASRVGKEVLQTGAQEGAEAAYDAYQDRRTDAPPTATMPQQAMPQGGVSPALRTSMPLDGRTGRPMVPSDGRPFMNSRPFGARPGHNFPGIPQPGQ